MPLTESITALMPFATSAFPYDGLIPILDEPFLDTVEDGRRGHTSPRAGLIWEDPHYLDTRTLLFVPAGFDPERPATLVVFFHGNNSTLERDVIGRQRVPAQLQASGLNAILAAPQLAYDAPDSSGGGFWRQNAFRSWLHEVAQQVSALLDPRLQARIDALPVVVVAYSGGYDPAIYSLSVGGASERICGVVLLDALYDLEEDLADWIERHRSAFFFSAYTESSLAYQESLQALLETRGIAYGTAPGDRSLVPGSATFVAIEDDIEHDDLVTRAWRDNPLQWLFGQLADRGRCGN